MNYESNFMRPVNVFDKTFAIDGNNNDEIASHKSNNHFKRSIKYESGNEEMTINPIQNNENYERFNRNESAEGLGKTARATPTVPTLKVIHPFSDYSVCRRREYDKKLGYSNDYDKQLISDDCVNGLETKRTFGSDVLFKYREICEASCVRNGLSEKSRTINGVNGCPRINGIKYPEKITTCRVSLNDNNNMNDESNEMARRYLNEENLQRQIKYSRVTKEVEEMKMQRIICRRKCLNKVIKTNPFIPRYIPLNCQFVMATKTKTETNKILYRDKEQLEDVMIINDGIKVEESGDKLNEIIDINERCLEAVTNGIKAEVVTDEKTESIDQFNGVKLFLNVNYIPNKLPRIQLDEITKFDSLDDVKHGELEYSDQSRKGLMVGDGKHKPFFCDDCGKSFSQLRNYKYHRSIHEGTHEFAAKCPECGKQFNDRAYLSSHMKIHRNQKEYKCEYCPKQFNQRVAYNMHVRIHTGLKPHECEICRKKFSRKMLLKQHHRVHTGEKPFTCHICGRKFADKSNLSLHIRLHAGIKPYHCTICNKAFTKKHHLKTHMNCHSGIKPYNCPKCGTAFSQSSNMRTHFKKCSK